MRRFFAEALPWLLTAFLLCYIAADSLGLLGELTLAVDGKTDTQRRTEGQ